MRKHKKWNLLFLLLLPLLGIKVSALNLQSPGVGAFPQSRTWRFSPAERLVQNTMRLLFNIDEQLQPDDYMQFKLEGFTGTPIADISGISSYSALKDGGITDCRCLGCRFSWAPPYVRIDANGDFLEPDCDHFLQINQDPAIIAGPGLHKDDDRMVVEFVDVSNDGPYTVVPGPTTVLFSQGIMGYTQVNVTYSRPFINSPTDITFYVEMAQMFMNEANYTLSLLMPNFQGPAVELGNLTVAGDDAVDFDDGHLRTVWDPSGPYFHLYRDDGSPALVNQEFLRITIEENPFLKLPLGTNAYTLNDPDILFSIHGYNEAPVWSPVTYSPALNSATFVTSKFQLSETAAGKRTRMNIIFAATTRLFTGATIEIVLTDFEGPNGAWLESFSNDGGWSGNWDQSTDTLTLTRVGVDVNVNVQQQINYPLNLGIYLPDRVWNANETSPFSLSATTGSAFDILPEPPKDFPQNTEPEWLISKFRWDPAVAGVYSTLSCTLQLTGATVRNGGSLRLTSLIGWDVDQLAVQSTPGTNDYGMVFNHSLVDLFTASQIRVMTGDVPGYGIMSFQITGIKTPSSGWDANTTDLNLRHVKAGVGWFGRTWSVDVNEIRTGVFLNNTIRYSNQLAGQQSNITFDWVMSSDLALGEKVVISLPNFFGPPTGDIVMKGADAHRFDLPGGAYWDDITKTLALTLDADDTPIVGGTEISVGIADIVGMYLPRSGTVQNDPSITMSSDSSAGAVTPTAAASPPIDTGLFLSSYVSFSPAIADTITEVIVSFTLSSDLSPGSNISVLLPGFSSPLFNLPVGGLHGSDYDDISAIWEPNNDRLTLIRDAGAGVLPGLTPQQISIPIGGSLRTPLRGLKSNDNSLRIRVSSATGVSVDETLFISSAAIPAFFDTKIQFSDKVCGRATEITLSFASTIEIRANETISLYLPGFSGTTGYLTPTDSSVDSGQASHWNDVTKTLTFDKDHQGLAENEYWTVRLNSLADDLKLPTSCITANTTSLLLSSSAAAGPIGQQFIEDVPGVNVGDFDSSILSFDPPISGLASQIIISVTLTADFGPGDRIKLTLPLFTGPTGPLWVSVVGDNELDFTEENAVVWRDADSSITLTLDSASSTIPGYTQISIEVLEGETITLPYGGLALDDPSLSIEGTLAICTIPSGPLTSVAQVNTGQFLWSEVRYHTQFSGVSSAVNVSFALSSYLYADEEIQFNLLNFGGPTRTNIAVEGPDKAYFDQNGAVSWSPITDILTLRLDSNVPFLNPAQKIVLTIPLSSPPFILPTSGLAENDPSVQISSLASAGLVSATPVLYSDAVSDGAFISSELSFDPPRNGVPTAITFTFVFSADLGPNDDVVLSLPGWTGPSGSVSVTVSGADGLDYDQTGAVIWDDTAKTVTFTRDTNAAIKTGGETIQLIVDLANGITIPTAGLSANDPSLQCFATAAAGTSVIAPVAITQQVQEGEFLVSSLAYSTDITSQQTHLMVNWTLSSDMQALEIVNLTLPGFSGPSGPIGVQGIDKTDYDDAGNVFWDDVTGTLSFRRNGAAGPLVGGTFVSLNIPFAAGLKVPSSGLRLNEPLLKISSNAAAGPVAPTKILNSPSVLNGKLEDAHVYFYPGVTGVKNAIHINFTLSSDLKKNEQVQISFPKFLSPNIWQHVANLGGPSAADFDIYGHAVWEYPARTFTLIRDNDAVPQTLPGNTPVQIEIPISNEIWTPTGGLEWNDVSLTLSSDASAGSISEVSIPRSNEVKTGEFLKSELSFDPDFVGLPSEITFKWTLSADILPGDWIIIELPFFGGPAAKTNLTLTGSDAWSFWAEWNPVGPSIKFERYPDVNKKTGRYGGTLIIAESDGISIPSLGISQNDPHYNVSTNAQPGPVLPPVSIQTTETVTNGKFSNDKLEYFNPTNGDFSKLELEFEVSAQLSSGNEIILTLPNFVCVACGAIPVTGPDGGLFNPGVWNAVLETLTLERTGAVIPANTLVNVTIDDGTRIKLPTAGLSANDPSLLISMSTGVLTAPPVSIQTSQEVSSGAFTNSEVSFVPTIAGTGPCQLVVDFTLTTALNGGDEIFVQLPGFSHPLRELTPSAGDYDDPGNVIWDNATETLTIRRNAGTFVLGGIAQTVTIPIAAGVFGFTLPTRQISSPGLFTFSSNAAAGAVPPTPNIALSTPILLGQIDTCSLAYSPEILGVASVVTFSCQFSSDLVIGQQVDLLIPNLIFNSPNPAVGGPDGADFACTVNGAVMEITRANTDLSGGTPFTITLGDPAADIVLPRAKINGLSLDDSAIDVSVGSFLTTGPAVPGGTIIASPAVPYCEFTNSQLQFGASTANNKTRIDLDYTLSCNQAVSDQIILFLPGFSRLFGDLLGINPIGGSSPAGHTGDTCNWDNDAETLTCIVAVSEVGGTTQTIVIDELAGIKTPPYGNPLNNPDLLIYTGTGNDYGKVGPTSILLSDSIGITSSLIDFSPALPFASSQITVQFGFTSNIENGETVTIALPGFNGTTHTPTLNGLSSPNWNAQYTQAGSNPYLTFTYTGGGVAAVQNLIIDPSPDLRIRSYEVLENDPTLTIISDAKSLGPLTQARSIDSVTPCKTTPFATHVVATCAAGAQTVIELVPFDTDASKIASTRTRITQLPDVGDLYQYDAGASDLRGVQITLARTNVTDSNNRVVYVAPLDFPSGRFLYKAYDIWDLESVDPGIIDITPLDGVLVESIFDYDELDWLVVTGSGPQRPSYTSTGMAALNRYIYFNGDTDNNRWYFKAPSQFYGNRANYFGGIMSFHMSGLEGDFRPQSRYNLPFTFVSLHCDTCGSAGLTASVRDFEYGGETGLVNITLAPSNFRADPLDDRILTWPVIDECDFSNILMGLSEIRIYADLTPNYESIAIDNFQITVSETENLPTSCYV